jgi:hypothetical protein
MPTCVAYPSVDPTISVVVEKHGDRLFTYKCPVDYVDAATMCRKYDCGAPAFSVADGQANALPPQPPMDWQQGTDAEAWTSSMEFAPIETSSEGGVWLEKTCAHRAATDRCAAVYASQNWDAKGEDFARACVKMGKKVVYGDEISFKKNGLTHTIHPMHCQDEKGTFVSVVPPMSQCYEFDITEHMYIKECG